MKTERVLVAVDVDCRSGQPTEGSLRAVGQARLLEPERSLTFLTSTWGDRYVDDGEHGYHVVHEGLSIAGREALDALASEHGADVVVSDAAPWSAVAELVREREIDLVVAGKREEGAHVTTLGSVAKKIVHDAPCAVWVVHGAAHAPKKVVAASDLTPIGQTVIAAAVGAAARFEAALYVAHAFQIPLDEQWTSDTRPAIEHLAARAAARVREQVEACGFDGTWEPLVACSSPTRHLLHVDQALRPDLFVLGDVSHKGLPGWLFGNTAERVLSRLQGSLLIVRPPAETPTS